MLSPEIIKKIRQIEIHTKRLLSGMLVGDYSSAKKGSGFEFDQIREYQVGDDIRYIDWKSSAKTNKLLIKQYIEERNRTVIIAVDVSASHLFSSQESNKAEIIAQIASALALIADYGKDHAALILFSEDIELIVPPGSGKKHIHTIMKYLFSHKASGKTTNLQSILKHLASTRSKDAIVFLVSDFINQGFEKDLKAVAKKYDLVAIRCLDQNEQLFPNVGFLTINDLETGGQLVLNTRSTKKRDLSLCLQQRIEDQAHLFKAAGVDLLDITTSRPFVGDIVKFFKRRMMY